MNKNFRTIRFIWPILGALLLLSSGCRSEKTAQIQLQFHLVWNGDIGLDDQGQELQLERLECYVSDFALHDTEEGWIDIDTVAHINFGQEGPMAVLDVVGTADREIDGIYIGLNVPADRNTDVDQDHTMMSNTHSDLRFRWHALGLGNGLHLQRVRRLRVGRVQHPFFLPCRQRQNLLVHRTDVA